ncbi:substrate-binding domain-containing protein [Chloroflexota bacterium]
MRKLSLFFGLVLVTILISGIIGCSPTTPATADYSPLPAKARLKVATTTSLYDTGLWGYLEPMFEEKYGVEVDVMYAGTGKAIEYGQRGDVDVITVHSKSRENAFVEESYGIERVPFAYNYFLIVGPDTDPARIKGMQPEDAFQKLMDSGSGNFISRGDDSGTHGKEKTIWKSAGFEYDSVQKAGTWYVEAGSGMGPTLNMASEKQGYTLTDMGTYLAFKGNLELVPIVDEGAILLNVYSALAVNPEKTSVKSLDMATNMINFLTSPDVQEIIGNYGVKEYGMQLFTPCAGNEPQ